MKTKSLATGLLVLIISISSVFAGNGVLLLESGTYSLKPNIASLSYADLQSAKFQNEYFVIVHFSIIPTNETKLKLEERGIRLNGYLPKNAYFARLTSGVVLNDLNQYGVSGIYPILPEYKMTKKSLNKEYPDHAISGNRIKLVVVTPSLTNDQKQAFLTETNSNFISEYKYSNKMEISVKVEDIPRLSTHPLVQYLAPIAPDPIPEDIQGQSNHRVNYISNPNTNAVPYNGEGVWVSVGDDGPLGSHIDFAGRVDQTNTSGSPSNDHGDHVSGIMIGAGNMDPEGQGMAWGADLKLYGAPFGSAAWDAVNSAPTDYFNPGVVVTSTSYGNGCNAGYTDFARTADQQVRQMPNLMHVFSAGNSGRSNCGYGAGAGWGNITGGIKAGKNVLAVGNLTTTDNLSVSSSRGPAKDGRIKPDICANGTNVYSTLPNYDYGYKTGTSMAAPGVSGTYANLVHAYRELNNGETPTSALIKGVMLNTADDLGNIGPDFKFGWGRLNARRAFNIIQDQDFILDSLSHQGLNTHTINIPANVVQLKVMVYWNDYEGQENAAVALVNNLDFSIIDQANDTLLPYILDHTPNSTTLNLPATNGIDSLNNMEQIVIDNPASGSLTARVLGTNVPQGPQRYYLIYEFIYDDIVVTYPIGGEGMVPGELEKIRWDALTTTQAFLVEYSADSGNTWSTVSTPGGHNKQASFFVPDTVSGEVLVRVSRNGKVGMSQKTFSIIGEPTNLNVTSVCTNSFELEWDSVPGATMYEVSVLGNKYMDSVITVTDNMAELVGFSANQSHWVSVKAKTNKAVGKRAIAIQKPSGIFNCTPSSNQDVGSNQYEPEVNIYPNPTSNVVFIELVHIAEESNIEILDLKGQKVADFQVSAGSGRVVLEHNVSSFPKGVYLIKWNSGNSLKFKKLILQ